jgi:hypothetical protein
MRLPFALWIRSQIQPFFQRQAADGVGTHQTYIRKELAMLVRLSMVRELSRADGDNRLFYEQIATHPWWGVIDAACRALRRSKETEHPRPADRLPYRHPSGPQSSLTYGPNRRNYDLCR